LAMCDKVIANRLVPVAPKRLNIMANVTKHISI
jgi:hypothetical protein